MSCSMWHEVIRDENTRPKGQESGLMSRYVATKRSCEIFALMIPWECQKVPHTNTKFLEKWIVSHTEASSLHSKQNLKRTKHMREINS